MIRPTFMQTVNSFVLGLLNLASFLTENQLLLDDPREDRVRDQPLMPRRNREHHWGGAITLVRGGDMAREGAPGEITLVQA